MSGISLDPSAQTMSRLATAPVPSMTHSMLHGAEGLIALLTAAEIPDPQNHEIEFIIQP